MERHGWLLLGSALVAVGTGALGLWIGDGFGQDMLASAYGAALSVPVTVFIVEGVLTRRHRAEWSAVRAQIASHMRTHAQITALKCHQALKPAARQQINSPMTTPSGRHAPMLRELAEALEASASDPDDMGA